MKHSYSKEKFEDVVKTSTSIREALNKLGIKSKGGNYRVFRKFAILYSIDYSHFTGKSWSKNKKLREKVDIQKYLNNEISISSYKLKKKLLELKHFEYRCSKCLNTEWLGVPISLELEHINGDPNDNNLSNLCLLCPNCHAQTSTYRGKNKKTCLLG